MKPAHIAPSSVFKPHVVRYLRGYPIGRENLARFRQHMGPEQQQAVLRAVVNGRRQRIGGHNPIIHHLAVDPAALSHLVEGTGMRRAMVSTAVDRLSRMHHPTNAPYAAEIAQIVLQQPAIQRKGPREVRRVATSLIRASKRQNFFQLVNTAKRYLPAETVRRIEGIEPTLQFDLDAPRARTERRKTAARRGHITKLNKRGRSQ